MAIVYNAQGEAKTLDAVDAREHVATGRWFNNVPTVPVAEVVAAPVVAAPVVEETPAPAPTHRSKRTSSGFL